MDDTHVVPASVAAGPIARLCKGTSSARLSGTGMFPKSSTLTGLVTLGTASCPSSLLRNAIDEPV